MSENLKDKIENLQNEIQYLIDSNIAYYKLWFFKVLMKSATVFLRLFLMLLFFLMFLFFGSIALAIYLGNLLDSYVLGSLIVGAIYLLFLMLIYFVKDKIVEGSILEKFSKVFFSE